MENQVKVSVYGHVYCVWIGDGCSVEVLKYKSPCNVSHMKSNKHYSKQGW